MKLKKSIFVLALALALMLGTVIGANGAGTVEAISALLCRSYTIEYNGEAQTFYDASGNRVYPISYNDSTYLPVRAVSEMLNLDVNWIGESKTVTIADKTAGTTAPTVEGVDLIDNFDIADRQPDWHGYNYIQSRDNQKIKVNGRVLDHWMRVDLRYRDTGYELTFNLPGEHNTLTLSSFASYDAVVTVYNNATKDSVLGTFEVKANTPSTNTVRLDGAVQIVLQAAPANKSVSETDYIYFYDAYLQ